MTPWFGAQEPLSALLHLGGALVYGGLTISLVHRTRRDWDHHGGRLLSMFVFALSCVSLLSISGLYHWTHAASPWRETFQRLDHAAIFVLIAGTLTPFHVLVFHGSWRWVMLGFAWLLAVVAIALKLLFFDSLSGGVGLLLYIGVGSVALISVCVLPRRVRLVALAPMAWGAVAYVGGAVLEVNGLFVLVDGLAGPHEVFHAAVLVGTGCHWRFLVDRGGRERRIDQPTTRPTDRLLADK